MSEEINSLQQKIYELTLQLNALKREQVGDLVPDYEMQTAEGPVSLRALFGESDTLLLIHNMGQGCRWCTLWADGINGFLPHLESAMSVVLVSKDPPELQRRFANERGWRFRLASHGGGAYIFEQSVMEGQSNMPGAVVYTLDGDEIRRKNAAVFGPGDLFCSAWNFLAMAGLSEETFTPQYTYWSRPAEMDDGGENLPD